jgi:GNAT superfamily N-acetyltransferase
MNLTIIEINPDQLGEYDRVPSRFEVRTILEPDLINNGLGGIALRETNVDKPYIKDYDTVGDMPSDMPGRFDIHNWAFFLAKAGKETAGAATVAFDTTGIFMLEARKNLSVLWDIRVRPQFRGAGIALLKHAAEWSKERGCTQMKIETQNVNVPACRFYERMGARLGEIHQYGYAAIPAVAHETMLCWYLDLNA